MAQASSSGELLERDSALELLAQAVADARAGAGSLVLVDGEAGVGKTTLLRRFIEQSDGDIRALWGSCDPLFTPRPLGPFVDVAEAVGGDLLTMVRSGAKPHEVAASLIHELSAASEPTFVVLDDMHWADEASLDVLRVFARRVERLRVVVAACYRSHEVGPTHALRVVVGELASTGVVRRIRLDPLSQESVASLAAPYAVDPVELYRKTGGNPLFVTEVLASGGVGIPETVRDAVLARAARLCSSARGILEIASVIPQPAELWLLRDIGGSGEDIDECLASGLVTAGPETLAFRHELVRLAIEDSVRPDRRTALHAEVLAALERAPAVPVDPARLAHHAEGAGDARAVLRYAPAAARRAAVLGAHREAAAQYERAARFSDREPLAVQASFYERHAYESYLTGDFADAMVASTEALDRYRLLGDRVREGACLHALSRLVWSSGRTPEALDLARQAVALLESLPAGIELALTYAHLAALSLSTNDLAGVAAWCTRAEDVAERLGASEVLAATRVTRYAAEYTGGSTEGRDRLVRELELALAEGLDAVAGRAFNVLVRAAMRQREYAVVDRYLEAGFEYCRDRQLGNFRQGLGAERARLYLDRGEWVAATDAAGLVLAPARTAGMAPFIALTVLGQVRARRGDPDVWEPLDRALEMAEPSGELQRLGLVAAARAEAAWLVGDHERVLVETDGAFRLALEKRHPWFAGELACWRRRSGAHDDVPEWIAEPFALELRGDWEQAALAWGSLGCPYEAACALGAGDEAAMRRALDQLNLLGARPAATILTRRLRERGVRGVARGPRRATRESPAGLTRRETEILGLLAQGMRNTDIADELVLSRRTVDHHVSAILRKLGARTRLEAVTEALKLGLVQPR